MNNASAANRRREQALKNLKANKTPSEKAVKEIGVLEERIKAGSKYRKYLRSVPGASKRSAASTPENTAA